MRPVGASANDGRRSPQAARSSGRSPRGRRRRAVRGPRGGRAAAGVPRPPPAARGSSPGSAGPSSQAGERLLAGPRPRGAEPLEERARAEEVEVGRVGVLVASGTAPRTPVPASSRRSASGPSRRTPPRARRCRRPREASRGRRQAPRTRRRRRANPARRPGTARPEPEAEDDEPGVGDATFQPVEAFRRPCVGQSRRAGSTRRGHSVARSGWRRPAIGVVRAGSPGLD